MSMPRPGSRRPRVRFYPGRVQEIPPSRALTPSQAVRLLDDPLRAAAAARTGQACQLAEAALTPPPAPTPVPPPTPVAPPPPATRAAAPPPPAPRAPWWRRLRWRRQRHRPRHLAG